MAVRTDRLAREHPWLLSRDLVQAGSAGIDPVGAHQLLRALSGARTPDGLANIMLGAVADTTGAGRVLLLTGEAEHLMVRAVHEGGDVTTVDGPWTEVTYDTDHRPARGGQRPPAHRRRRPFGVAPATGTPSARRRSGHPRRSNTGAGQDDWRGLRRASTSRAERFTAGHEEAVAFLCAQAAAPLWNFQLEARLRAADEYRQSLMDVQSRFVPNELLRILDIDDLRRVRSGYRVEREMTVLISDIRGYTDAARGHERVRGEQPGDGVPAGGRTADHQLQRHDPGRARGRDRRRLRVGAADAVRAGLAMLRSLREHNRERTGASAPRSCGWGSASTPAAWESGSSAG